jgi:hypothetical protein
MREISVSRMASFSFPRTACQVSRFPRGRHFVCIKKPDKRQINLGCKGWGWGRPGPFIYRKGDHSAVGAVRPRESQRDCNCASVRRIPRCMIRTATCVAARIIKSAFSFQKLLASNQQPGEQPLSD